MSENSNKDINNENKNGAARRKREPFMVSIFKTLFTGRRKGDALSIMEEEQVQSPSKTIIKQFFKRKLTIIGLIGLFSVVAASFLMPIFVPIDLAHNDSSMQNMPPGLRMMRVPASFDGNAQMISAGAGWGLGLNKNGGIHIWGEFHDNLRALPPAEIGRVVYVSAGQDHAVVVTESGNLYAWGNPFLGIIDVPAHLQGRVVMAEAGRQFTIVLLDNGRIEAFGNTAIMGANILTALVMPFDTVVDIEVNTITGGVLTDDGRVQIITPRAAPFSEVPDEIQGRVVNFALTDRNGAAVLDDGTVVTWGLSIDASYIVPDEIQGRALTVQAGRSHFSALLNDGTVVSWGNNYNRQIDTPNLTNIVSVHTDFNHNYAIDADGNVHTWGMRGFLFGSDQFGRDIFMRLWSAGRISLLFGVIAVVVMGFIGVTLGGLAGFYGKGVDMFIMRMAEVVQSLPFLPIAIILSWVIGNALSQEMRMVILMVILGCLSWPGLMRLTRGQILQAREAEYVTAARSLGVKEGKIISRHILPNVLSVVIVSLTLGLAASMLTESGLSFVGFGIMEPLASWGNMLTGANSSTVLRDQWWRWVFPALALVTTTLSINLIGDGLREAIDPRSRGRA